MLSRLRYLTDFAQVAELGGTLGLFVGFSFLGVFDVFVNISCTAKNIFFQATLLKKKKRLNLYCVLLWPNFERDNIQILTSVKKYLQKGTVGSI